MSALTTVSSGMYSCLVFSNQEYRDRSFCEIRPSRISSVSVCGFMASRNEQEANTKQANQCTSTLPVCLVIPMFRIRALYSPKWPVIKSRYSGEKVLECSRGLYARGAARVDIVETRAKARDYLHSGGVCNPQLQLSSIRRIWMTSRIFVFEISARFGKLARISAGSRNGFPVTTTRAPGISAACAAPATPLVVSICSEVNSAVYVVPSSILRTIKTCGFFHWALSTRPSIVTFLH